MEADEDIKDMPAAPLHLLETAKPNEHLPSPELGEQTNLLPYSFPKRESSTPSRTPKTNYYSQKMASHSSSSSSSQPSTSRSSTTTKDTYQRRHPQTPSSSTTTTTTTKMPPPPPSSSSKPPNQPIPIAIQILAHSDRHNHPYTADSVRPRHAFTLRLLPRTRIRELCLHAADWVRLHGASPLSAENKKKNNNNNQDEAGDDDSARATSLLPSFKARDRDGHALDASETVADALMAGETLFLIEKSSSTGDSETSDSSNGGGDEGKTRRDRLSSHSRSRSRSSKRGRDDVLRGLRAEAARRSRAADARTPSVASTSPSRSRSRSTCSKKKRQKENRAGAEPPSSTARKTPSQRALEIAMQHGRASSLSLPSSSMPEPRGRGRALVTGSSTSKLRRGRLGSGGGADIVDTIEESPSPPLPRSVSASQGKRAPTHETAAEDAHRDGDTSSPQKQQEGDETPLKLFETSIKDSPTSKVSKEQERNCPTALAKKQDDASTSSVVASKQSQSHSLPSPALSPSLLPQKSIDSQLVIPDSQDPPTPAVHVQSKPALSVNRATRDDETASMARNLKLKNASLSSELGGDKQADLSQAAASTSTHSSSIDGAHDKPAQQPASPRDHSSINVSKMWHKLETTSSLPVPKLHQPEKSDASPTRPSASVFQADLLAPRSKPARKLDPYEIITDDESESPQPNSFLQSSIRRLGSATNRAPASSTARTPTPAFTRNSLLIARRPTTVTDEVNATIPSTPLAAPSKQTSTPVVHAVPSSPSAPLPSSPTDLVAAVLSRTRSQPKKKQYFVIEESDVEAGDDDENVLNEAQDRFSSSRQPQSSQSGAEAALPWSVPPLRLELEEDAFWPLRTVGKRAPVLRGQSATQLCVEEDDVKADINKLVELDKKNAAAMMGSGKSKQDSVKKTEVPAPGSSGTPVKRQLKHLSQTTPSKSPMMLAKSNVTVAGGSKELKQDLRLENEVSSFNPSVSPGRRQIKGAVTSASQATPGKSPVLLVHGSSSSDEGVEEIGWVKSGQKHPPILRQAAASSPSKNAAILHTTSQNVSDEKGQESTKIADQVIDNDAALDPLSDLPETDAVDLPVIDEPVVAGLTSQQDEITSRTKPPPPPEIPKTDPITATDLNETPPSAQASKRAHQQNFEKSAQTSEQKRKRQPSDEPEPEDQRRRQKRLRREARDALKAERHRRLQAEEAQREAERARLEEERKRLAMEQAHKRAKALEMIVSSPLKAAEMGLVLSETSDSERDEASDEFGDGKDSPLNQRQETLGLNTGTSFEESDDNDSISSRGSDRRPSWRELSRRHFSASPQSSAFGQVAGEGADAILPNRGPAKQQNVIEDKSKDMGEVTKEQHQQQQQQQFQHSQFIDWAFLEGPLRPSAYSPLEMHNRIHLRMMHASLRGMSRPAEEAGANYSVPPDTSQANLDKMASTKSKRRKKEKLAVPTLDGDDDESQSHNASPRSVRSAAPSPKDMAATSAQDPKGIVSNGQGQDRRTTRKNQRRKKKDRERKKQRLQKKPESDSSKARRLAWSVMHNKMKK